MPLPKSLFTLLSHHFSTAAKTTTNLPKVPNVPTKYKSEAINQAQKVLTDYLHTTRSLPYTYAEHISKNALFSLANLVKKVPYSAPNFPRSFQRFLRYHPINEFEFFFESIGIEYSQVSEFLPTNTFFFSEDETVLDAACVLSGFGFPWKMLGKLYREEHCIFRESSEELKARLCGFKEYGWSNLSVVGMCLAFPRLLRVDGELGGEVVALMDDLKRVFVELDIANCVEGNVDTWYEVCRTVRVFYDLGIEKGKVGELLGRKKDIFLQHPEEVLVRKANYFCRLGVRKEDVGLLLLQRPEVLNLELEKTVISTLGLLKHLGLNENELKEVSQKYPYAMGRNKMVNVPHLMRALDLHEWFFTRIKNEHQLLANYVLSDSDEEHMKKEFSNGLEQFQSCKTPLHAMKKLNFMHGIGFGENPLTLKVLARIHGRSSELQKRFDILLNAGLEFSQLCLIISTAPKILNQNPEYLEEKVNFLCGEMKSSLEYLNVFPAFLCFDLENRIKPRYRFFAWLKEKGLHPESYSFATMIATSEKRFVAQAFTIHPAAPKHWFECFLI
ncbi:putative transcription regulator mTERF family [Rosa chinensis]|uniref:Putative transcription regulator mTERF family n=1 Tax=Rosa chinensis TaxID=74649 RepID=A0A2P6SF40_ROSCH|nr:transcription termination factor MTEF18, mitochondrial [Rosa chinensis]XP_024170187.1 transcription termination factor MTEF18, mitochondrial [Rosa chinensis]XP_024170194.1 transcription termination factor MTEF18, mitochondrial [Rosa chinensis]XP_040361514.1 transcription termination factor MTEF18, mitochondrial [Rosa chinensis]PRQ57298.1 putative transcription regulator mTERF family [Rosa chinensis]